MAGSNFELSVIDRINKNEELTIEEISTLASKFRYDNIPIRNGEIVIVVLENSEGKNEYFSITKILECKYTKLFKYTQPKKVNKQVHQIEVVNWIDDKTGAVLV